LIFPKTELLLTSDNVHAAMPEKNDASTTAIESDLRKPADKEFLMH
jgi:hypothetical protein